MADVLADLLAEAEARYDRGDASMAVVVWMRQEAGARLRQLARRFKRERDSWPICLLAARLEGRL